MLFERLERTQPGLTAGRAPQHDVYKLKCLLPRSHHLQADQFYLISGFKMHTQTVGNVRWEDSE